MGKAKHGTSTMYQYGCRCSACCAANTASARMRNDRKPGAYFNRAAKNKGR